MAQQPTATQATLDILGVLKRRWGIVALGVAAGLALGVTYLLVAPKIYSSEAKILVMRRNPDLPVQSAHAYGQPPQQEIGDALLSTHMEIIRSPRVIGDAVDARKLEGLESLQPELDPDLARIDHRRAVIDYVLEQLIVERGGEELDYAPLTFTAEFRHTSDEDAATILAAIVESYERFLEETLQDVNSEAAQLIGGAKDELSSDIRQLEQQYQEFRMRTPMLTVATGDMNKHQIRLGLLQTELTRLELRESELVSRLDILRETAAKERLASFSDLERLGLIDNRDVERLALLVSVERGDANANETFVAAQPIRATTEETEVQRLLTLQMNLREERRRLGDSHPRVADLEQAVREVSDFIEKKRASMEPPEDKKSIRSGTLVSVYEKVLEKDLDDVRNQLKEVRKTIDAEEQAAVLLVADELKNENLREELQRTKSLQLAVVEWLRQRSMMAGYGGFITEVLEAPALGELAWPKIPIVLAAALCLGLLGGSGVSLLVDLGDRSFRSTAEIEQVVHAPLLGAVRKMKFRRRGDADPAISEELVVYHQPMSTAAEAYRQIRTSLLFSPEGKQIRMLQLTSPNPGDGKTLTAGNLAASIAQTGKRVLLVDCDLRRPRTGKLFGLTEHRGLAELLRDEVELTDVVVDTSVPRLSVIASGASPKDPAELLQSPRFQQLLGQLREKFDMVILDSTPLLAVSESASIAPEVDGIVLCVRTMNTSRPETQRAVQQLEAVGARVTGFVVNDLENLVRRGEEGQYGGGYYGNKARRYYLPNTVEK